MRLSVREFTENEELRLGGYTLSACTTEQLSKYIV